jgi:hypothetical protein
MTKISSGEILMWGAANASGFFGDTWVLDSVGWTEVLPGSNPPGRCGHAMCRTAMTC